jgi:transcriptional regulator with XRE-family HTH domain
MRERDLIGEILKLRKMSQAQLSRDSGVSEGEINRIRNNEREPKLRIVKQLAKALNVTIDLLAGEKSASPITPSVLAGESLTRFLWTRPHFPPDVKREFEDLIARQIAPTTVSGWIDHFEREESKRQNKANRNLMSEN